MHSLFKKAADLGVGIELNSFDMNFAEEEAETVLRPYRIAKKCGCKFYLGSDAHSAAALAVPEVGACRSGLYIDAVKEAVTLITDYIVAATTTTIVIVPIGLGLLTQSW